MKQPMFPPCNSFENSPRSMQAGWALHSRASDPEYPFWVLLHQMIGKDVLIESVAVENISNEIQARPPPSLRARSWRFAQTRSQTLKVNGSTYRSVRSYNGVSVLMP